MRALLLGSAPCLLDQIRLVNLESYSLVCCINNIFTAATKDLFEEYGLNLDYYFFSDDLYFSCTFQIPCERDGKTIKSSDLINSIRASKKIMCRPIQKGSVGVDLSSEGIVVCPPEVTSFVNWAGGYGGFKWASTGLYSLGYLLLEEKIGVDLAGFSFFEGILHYYDDEALNTQCHEPEKEKAAFGYLSKNFDCKMLPSL